MSESIAHIHSDRKIDMGVAPHAFAMAVAIAASTGFLTPVSSSANSLVTPPGGYSFGDFVRVGAPMAVLVMIVTVVLVPLLFPF
jgi:di/tricarboxylate transporter